MERREFISAMSAVAATGLAGCSQEPSGTPDGPAIDRTHPETVFREYLAAIKAEDMEQVRSLRSSEVDEQNIAAYAVEYNERNMEIEYVSVDNSSENESTLSYVLSMQDGESGFSVSGEAMLVRQDGKWYVEEVR